MASTGAERRRVATIRKRVKRGEGSPEDIARLTAWEATRGKSGRRADPIPGVITPGGDTEQVTPETAEPARDGTPAPFAESAPTADTADTGAGDPPPPALASSSTTSAHRPVTLAGTTP